MDDLVDALGVSLGQPHEVSTSSRKRVVLTAALFAVAGVVAVWSITDGFTNIGLGQLLFLGLIFGAFAAVLRDAGWELERLFRWRQEMSRPGHDLDAEELADMARKRLRLGARLVLFVLLVVVVLFGAWNAIQSDLRSGAMPANQFQRIHLECAPTSPGSSEDRCAFGPRYR